MIYPGTSGGNFMTGAANDDNKKKLVDMLSQRLQAAPSFGGAGRSTSDLPQVGSPAISYNPFLAMLAGRPNETFNDLPTGISSAIAGGVQAGPGPIQGGGAQGDPSNAAPAPNQNFGPTDSLTSHPLFDQAPPGGSGGSPAPPQAAGNNAISAFGNVGGAQLNGNQDFGITHGLGQQYVNPQLFALQQLIAYNSSR